jgi:hypothetical protein
LEQQIEVLVAGMFDLTDEDLGTIRDVAGD